MKIEASCLFNLETVKSLTYLTMFKKGNPKKRNVIFNIIFVFLLILSVFDIIMFGYDLNLVLTAVLSVIALLWNAYMWFLYPKVRYNALGKMKGVENKYIFADDKIYITSSGAEYNGNAEIEYTLLLKVYETSNHFFLFQTKNQVFIVNKATVHGGTAEDIRNKLSGFLNDKYVICKY